MTITSRTGLDRVAVVDVVAADVAVQGIAGGGEQLCIGARKVSGCLSHTHYSILNYTDTKDVLYLSDAHL